jgi:Peptidase C13 family
LKRAALYLCCFIAACASRVEPVDPLPQPTGWTAVLIAGDESAPAFDNAVDVMAETLESYGVDAKGIVTLKASAGGTAAATRSNIDRAFTNLAPAAGQGCFVFVTSHGDYGRGLVLAASRTNLAPGSLNDLLDRKCGDRPTVVIMSGCFSGIYASRHSMQAANRIILTAARDDRASFGCGAGSLFTVFDYCILTSIERSLSWQAVMGKTRGCVARYEEETHSHPPSSPQIFVGQAMELQTAFPP